ncbi:hypothetical protein ASE07_24975 [Noviherbaspirillum sp. Root189]|nr:hypothetical protein ASE07_24975 [Noviherbaspirillum sp. Root189]
MTCRYDRTEPRQDLLLKDAVPVRQNVHSVERRVEVMLEIWATFVNNTEDVFCCEQYSTQV